MSMYIHLYVYDNTQRLIHSYIVVAIESDIQTVYIVSIYTCVYEYNIL